MAPPAVDSLHRRWLHLEEVGTDAHTDEAHWSRLKEHWFLEAFKLLQDAPAGDHCWCTYQKIMDPLLEPFSFYFEQPLSDLHALWRRLCSELNACTKCVIAYHESKDRYRKDYDEAHVEPLLNVLQLLDEERVATHLETLMNIVREEKFDSTKHTMEVITVLFEVLMFPSLLEDAEVSERFAPFLQYVEDTHDLALAKGPQYPGVYTLLVHSDQNVRRVAFKLVQSLEMVKDAQEMEAIAPLLEKVMHCLEFEEFEPGTSGVGQRKLHVEQKEITQSSHLEKRPRVRFKRETLWLGLPNILERLQPAALEEGIVERYSVFVSIVLNHVSEYDEAIFYQVLKCLELLLSNLGYSFWLRTTFSAGVVRNTLVSQCFHSNLQRMHRTIFDLFPPFLLSLETLQDEYERQRRRLLYFLLQQVPASKNFNLTMRWKARQVSFKIICSGYTMEPPLPPWECAHVWGPSLVETLKDPNMHGTFRSAAFDLIQTILAADTSALAAFSLKPEVSVHPWSHLLENGNVESGHGLRAASEDTRDQDYWKILKKVSATMSEGFEKWSCVPLLWIEVLGGVLAYPTSFYKSVLWAYGRIAILDPPDGINVLNLEVGSKGLRWESPQGYDDQRDSDACVNVVPVQQHCLQLISTFKRYADGFLDRLGFGTVLHHLTLEAWLAEPLLLLLMNSKPDWKEIAQKVLTKSGANPSLESELKLLCEISVSAVCDAVRHASNTLLNWPLEDSERALGQLFFFGLKLISVNQGAPAIVESGSLSGSRKLCESVSMILWPLVGRTITESKNLIGGKHELMLTRMLQLLPSVCKHMPMSFWNGLLGILNPKRNNIIWFHDLFTLGSLASRAVLRWWQNATCDIVDNLVQSGYLPSALKDVIDDLLKPGCPLDEDQQRRLKFLMESASARNSYTRDGDSWSPQVKSTKFVKSTGRGPCSTAEIIHLDSDDENAQETHSQSRVIEEVDRNVIDVERLDHVTSALSDVTVKDHKEVVGDDDRIDKEEEREEEAMEEAEERKEEEIEEAEDPADSVPLASLFLKPQPTPSPHTVHPPKRKPGGSKLSTLDKYVYKTPKPPTGRPVQRKRSNLQSRPRASPSVPRNQVNLVNLKQLTINKEPISAGKQLIVAESGQKSKPQVMSNQGTLPRLPGHAAQDKAILRELVMDDDNDDFGKALNLALIKKTEKRQVMTLQMPGEHRRPAPVARPVPERAPPPKLDMWFRQILSMDYFSTVGLECLWIEDRQEAAPLPRVPTSFPSALKYKEIFQPLLLEEFKAQLEKSYGELSFDGKTCAVLRLMSLERVDDFQIGRFLADGREDAARNWTENDLLLLTRYRLEPDEPQSCHLLAKVDRKEKEFRGTPTTFLLKLCMPHGNSRLQNAKKYLVIRSKWHITKVMNLATQVREFQALSAVGNFPLLQTILCTSLPGKHSLDKNGKVGLKGLTTELGDRLRFDYNESQVSAIAAAVGQQDLAAAAHQLALVQGPPGTGKTRTIVGIVSALLAWEPQSEKDNMRASTNVRGGTTVRLSVSSSVAVARAWQDAALAAEISGGKENLSGLGKAKESTTSPGGSRKQRILVCAQSNAAVDELVLRLCKDGLYDKHGEFFRPFLVRVGNEKSVHPASMDIFIDTLVEKRLIAERSAANMDDNRQQKTSLLRRKLEEVIETIEVLEASHAKRGGGDTLSRDVLSDESINDSVQDASEAPAAPAEKETVNAELAKRVDRVVQEGDSAVQGKLNTLYGQRGRLYTELRNAEKEEKKTRGEEWAKRQEMRRTVIREADVVLATLSGSGADVYTACMETFVPAKKFQPRKVVAEDDFFSAVVIDEAGQALEPATLIPLQLLKQTQARCVMVGDPKQLPATVNSQILKRTNYETSMFERLQRAGYPVTVLNIQYRMHPEIRQFPSAHFYDNQLRDGLAEESRKAPFHNERCFAPYVFFDVDDGRQRIGSTNSLCNDAEADAALDICRAFQQRYPEEANSRSISVITPYNEQRTLLQERFKRILGSAKAHKIDFNTVDGYQGREVDILIFSAVRASGQSNDGDKRVGRGNISIGFVADVRRMNVALTRARFSLWIIGNATTLQQNRDWAALILDARSRHLYFPVKGPCVFEKSATSQIPRVSNLSPGSYLDNLTTNEARLAGANAEHIAMWRSSEMGCVSAHPTERLDYVNLEEREGIGFVKSASHPREVEKAILQENVSSFGSQSVARDTSKQSEQAQGRRLESAVDEPRMQKNNSIPRGERSSQLRTSATRNDDEKKQVLRRHPDGTDALPCPKPSDESALGLIKPRLKDAGQQNVSSRSRKDLGTGTESGTGSRSTQDMPRTGTCVDGQSHKFESVVDRAVGLDEVRRSLSEEPRPGLRRVRVSAAGTTVATRDSSESALRARPKVAYVDFTSGHLEKSSVMKATAKTPVERTGRDRSSEDRIERNRPGPHNRSGQSVAGVLPAASLLNSDQRAGIRLDSVGSASASRDEGSRAPAGHRSRNSPRNTSHMAECEWELYMRTLQEEKQTGNAVRDRSDRAQSSGSDRRSRQGGRPDTDLQTRQAGQPGLDIRTNQAGKTDLDRQTNQAAKRDADTENERRCAHPPTKKQKTVGGSSASAQNTARPSTVDDILSGLSSLSRSQVIGSKVITESLTKHNTTRRF